MIRRLGLLAALLVPAAAAAQPVSHSPGVSIREVRTLPPVPVRLAHDPATGALWIATFLGDLVRLDAPFETGAMTVVATEAEHGTPKVRGMTVGPDGEIVLVGNDEGELETRGIVRRGTLVDGVWTWEDVLRTEPYATTGGSFDHQFSSVTFSPDGAWMFVASGSRTDHGEIQPNDGVYPGLRDQPLTTKLFRLPADARDVLLPNDEAALRTMGVIYAEGFRNAFDLAWDADGELFAVDNAGDRDDGEELNWVREDHHYGFPWRMGLHDTPQQFSDYDPDADPLVNPQSYAYRNGYFHDDPTYPAPPDGVAFTDPIQNTGPDADFYRAGDGSIQDASVTGATVASFTPHRSPLGLVFDRESILPDPFRGDGFVLSYTSIDSRLLGPFGDESEDVLHLQLSPDRTTMSATRIASGFDSPIDAVHIGQALYVAELGARAGLWALDLTFVLAATPDPDSGLALAATPNPSRGDGHVTVASPSPQSVRVVLIDALGRKVAVLHDGAMTGTRDLPLPADLAPGVYRVLAVGAEDVAGTALTVAR